jgi:hypothetical protein
MSAKSLLPFAIERIRQMTEELEISHTDPVSGEIEPAAVGREVQENKRWLKQAATAVKA